MNSSPIGVFDSGVGGLTVFQAMEHALADETLVYLGDTARVPYGTKSAETVVRYSLEAAHFLLRQGVKMLVVACNSASSVALDIVEREAGVPVLGVIEPGAKRAAELSEHGRIGIIGTRGTVGSGAYSKAIHELRPGAEVLSQPCPLFVPLVEEGWTENEIAHRVAETYLTPFKRAEVDTLVLGCTHYPLLGAVIAEVMGPGVRLVDSAASVAAEVQQLLQDNPALAAEGRAPDAEHRFYVTDVPDPFQIVAERFLGRKVERLEQVRIEGE